MRRYPHPALTLVALATAAGGHVAAADRIPLARPTLVALRNREPQRKAQVAAQVAAAKAAWGLGPADGFRELSATTDAFGITHVRFRQTYQGVDVWNGTALGHLDAQGVLQPVNATLQKAIALPAATLFTPGEIEAKVGRLLPRSSRRWPMQIRPIVFPTRYQEGIKFVRNGRGELELDLKHSVGTMPKREPYVWAYQVGTLQAGARGLEATTFIVDARTGEVLRKWDGQQHVDGPATGTGRSQYNGTVALNTTFQDSTGQYVLTDATRPTQPWKFLNYFPWFTEWNVVGIQTLLYDPNQWSNTSGTTPFTSADNTWGDGTAFDWAVDYPGNLYGAHAQTAAVDAHFGVQATWDYYAQVHGRTGGIDGQGSSPVSLIHMDDGSGNAMYNASWVGEYFMMMYGDGAPTGALTSLDVTAHEVSHGVLDYTTNLSYSAEGGGLSEANSDIHATMAKFWMWGANGTGDTVPSTTTTAPDNSPKYLWSMSPQTSLSGRDPMRTLYKPSLDGLSYDAWFDGIGLDDAHFSMGPGTRFFYFLSQGASATAGDDAYSPYLPGGMSGIGNDKAIKIWYRAMDTEVTDMFADYHQVREAVVAAAEFLFPGTGSLDSPEVTAVKDAFAAVNIGAPSGGREPVTVIFPDMPMARELFYQNKKIVLPAMVPLQMPAPTVSNTSDTRLLWSLGGLNFRTEGGHITPEGTFTGPAIAGGMSWPIKATSQADPKQFAVNLAWVASMDADSDTETDACDLGAIALDYYPYNDIYTYPGSVIYRNNFTDDLSCLLFLMGFTNAFHK